MILLSQSRERNETPTEGEAMGQGPVGPCLNTSLHEKCLSQIVWSVSPPRRHISLADAFCNRRMKEMALVEQRMNNEFFCWLGKGG
ncbi:hypothetical protein TNCV_1408701 [Trichonephila clavipes]|uniref:Uncharacterized protein n=1 Tax=Trichonephila clavipes TaxID=2585209 RepID=A0A8X6UP24_TRICX|nr:hypothetical protein TNCV_1408701 [Trichonephila clavipes]